MAAPPSAVLLSAALRVLSRAAAIQVEEAALAAGSHSLQSKGKGRATTTAVNTEAVHENTAFSWPSPTPTPEVAQRVPLEQVLDVNPTAPSLGEKERTQGRSIETERSSDLRQTAAFSPGFQRALDDDKPGERVESVESVLKEERAEFTERSGEIWPESADLPPPRLPSAADEASVEVPPAPMSTTAPSTPEPPIADTTASDSVEQLSMEEKDVILPSAAVDMSSVPGAEAKLIEETDDEIPVVLRASTVPSSRIGRLFHYGSLAASLSWGAASESIRRSTGSGGTGSVFMSDANVRRLVATLGRMRGAALKLGQFMSIQDNTMLPPEIERVLQQVQAHANYMPEWQMEKVLSTELGAEWESLFSTFDRTPIASASIGQVHRATLAEDGTEVAVKIQFPGVSSSINSDLANLSLLLRGSAVLPKGLYLQNTIAVMRRELEDECDYVREGQAGRKFGEYLKDDAFFKVPRVVQEATTGKVLTTEWMSGKPLSKMKHMSQETRDKIGESVLRLCLQELFQFRFMQTDPNWANFLYDSDRNHLQLIDFGASREYTKEFMDGWYRLLSAALRDDRVAMKTESESLGYLTGDEEEIMLNAHLESMSLLASPFRHRGIYAFANQTITDSVRKLIPIMLQHRLTPPPPETYSLNRKLSGAFLMCAKLGANVDCGRLWEDVVGGYKEGPEVLGAGVESGEEESKVEAAAGSV